MQFCLEETCNNFKASFLFRSVIQSILQVEIMLSWQRVLSTSCSDEYVSLSQDFASFSEVVNGFLAGE
jgi:hypothetical protein